MEGLMAFLNNPLVLTLLTVAFGLFVTYFPAAASWPRLIISFANALIAFLVKIGGVAAGATTPEHAVQFSTVVASAPVGASPDVFGLAGASIWQAAIAWLMFKLFFQDPIEKGAGIGKMKPDGEREAVRGVHPALIFALGAGLLLASPALAGPRDEQPRDERGRFVAVKSSLRDRFALEFGAGLRYDGGTSHEEPSRLAFVQVPIKLTEHLRLQVRGSRVFEDKGRGIRNPPIVPTIEAVYRW